MSMTRQQKRALARYKSKTKVQDLQEPYNKLIFAEVSRKGQFKIRSKTSIITQGVK